MPSFDIVSKLDWPELGNALDQARREVAQRFDFKRTDASLERVENSIVIQANAEDRVKAAIEVLRDKLVRRKVSLKHLDVGEILPGPKGSSKSTLTLREGIDTEHARILAKKIKDSDQKVQATIQQECVRVTGKKRDDLQAIIAELRAISDIDIELQFTNFRE
jgi:uncharacterized protein YajQ (UPF0234 family)